MKETPDDLSEHADAFASLGHPARILILRSALQAHPEGLISSQIQEIVDVPASTLSHHLDAMRQAGLLKMQKEGRTRRYMAECERLSLMMRFLFEECCTKSNALDADEYLNNCLPKKGCC